jgi:hypothetical protein
MPDIRKVDAVFAHVLLSFGDVPFEVQSFTIRVTRRSVKYMEIEEQLSIRIIQVNSRTAITSGYDRVQSTRKSMSSGRAIGRVHGENTGLQDLTPALPLLLSSMSIAMGGKGGNMIQRKRKLLSQGSNHRAKYTAQLS